MKGIKLTIMLSAVLFFAGCGLTGVKAPSAAAPKVVNKYHQAVEGVYCTQCHDLKGDAYLLKKFDPDDVCRNCHPPTGKDHPLHLMVKGEKMAVELPLYQNKIACLTCHDPHNSQGYSALLRIDGANLCQNCHSNK